MPRPPKRPARAKSRKNPSRPLRRGVVQAPRSLGEKILPWSTTGSALRTVGAAFVAGRPVPQADARRALYEIRTLRARYADRDLADIERALAARVEPRTNPLRPPAAIAPRPATPRRSRVDQAPHHPSSQPHPAAPRPGRRESS